MGDILKCPGCGYDLAGNHTLLGCIGFLQATIRSKDLEIAADDKLLADYATVLDALPCPEHQRCVPHALHEILRMKKRGPDDGWSFGMLAGFGMLLVGLGVFAWMTGCP